MDSTRSTTNASATSISGTLVAGLGHNDITVETHTSIPAEVIGSGVGDPPRGDKE